MPMTMGCGAPSAIRSPTTASPVAMPSRTRRSSRAGNRVTASITAKAAVAKYMGDGVLIYFGYPQAHEDDAEQAVYARLAAQVREDVLERHALSRMSRQTPNAVFAVPQY